MAAWFSQGGEDINYLLDAGKCSAHKTTAVAATAYSIISLGKGHHDSVQEAMKDRER